MKIERLPLNALRAFAEAARTESFKSAASHLGVTPGAVSRQIKQLEARLGISLFARHANGVHLNEAGRQLARDIDSGLERIAAGVMAAQERARRAPMLTLSAPPSFMQLWLLPRLADFDARVGGIDISLDASQSLTIPAWQGDGARLAIRYGRGPWPEVKSHRLFGDELFPVCAPSLLEREDRPMEPADLANHTLLEVAWESRQGIAFPGWQAWLDAAGVGDRVTPPQRRYSLFGLAMDQAIAGRGIMLANHPVAMDRLESGVLVRPFGGRHVLPSPMTYDLLVPPAGEAPPAVAGFIDWLLNEAAAFDRDTIGKAARS
ncbi:LysR substrate-binding domain-containing protein [Halomonas sp. M4R1S46]|uniref:LysR substrate-binding domain-containing protein n=1 Tax=Halomonas sp. M4R1S46 TaxID=2982692 RepID=UPI0021E405E5|nr:LysR substrate-binding domain-containing protein [Halomonas sp. M4R1S46]UYG07155.1 LysR substrate-binding domain-containing protein [Halomonas sp. M4R1S46]